MWQVWMRAEAHTGFWWRNLRKKDNLEEPGVDGRIKLRWIFKKCGSECRISPAKMTASATATGSRHISVNFRHGSGARPGGCCAGCMTSHYGYDGTVVDGRGRDVEWKGERGIKKKPTYNSNLKMITGERGIKKEPTYNSNLKMITGERGIKKKSQLITLT